MATFVLIPGAGSTAWYWHLVEPELRTRGHDVIAVTLPVDDDAAGLDEYTDAVVAAITEHRAGRGGDRTTSCSWPSRWAGSPRRSWPIGCPWR